jgi:hypothetical protein
MGHKLAIAGLGLVMLWASQSWAGSTGNGWTQPAAAPVHQAQPQPTHTWKLHGKWVTCASTTGWRRSDANSREYSRPEVDAIGDNWRLNLQACIQTAR